MRSPNRLLRGPANRIHNGSANRIMLTWVLVLACVGSVGFWAAARQSVAVMPAGEIDEGVSLGVQRAALALETKWVPAIENRGEGVFVAFRPEASVHRRQLCWAHLLRQFVGFQDYGGKARRYGRQLEAQAKEMFRLWHRVRDGTLRRAEFQKQMEPIERAVGDLLRACTGVRVKKVAGRGAQFPKVGADADAGGQRLPTITAHCHCPESKAA